MQNFDNQAKDFFNSLIEKIESQDVNSEVEININNDVLTIEVGNKIFVINKQPSVQEIWLASPVSGPHHFKYLDGQWTSKRGLKLDSTLIDDINHIKPLGKV